MAGEFASIATEATPFAIAATSAYGKTVLAKARDDVADASLRAGVSLLQRVFGHRKQGEELPPVIIEVIKYPADEDYIAQLRLAIRKALETDEAMASDISAILREVRAMPQAAQHVVSGRDSSVTFFGRDGFIAGRDIKFSGPPAGRLSSGLSPHLEDRNVWPDFNKNISRHD